MNPGDEKQTSYNDAKAIYQHVKAYRQKTNQAARSIEIEGRGGWNMFVMTLVLGPYVLYEKHIEDFQDGGPKPFLPATQTAAFLEKFSSLADSAPPDQISLSGEDVILFYILASIGRRCALAFDKQSIQEALGADDGTDEHFLEWKEFYLQATEETLEYISWRFRGDEEMVKMLEAYSQGTEHFREPQKRDIQE
jgi:hypothetical protein